jgi:hypothetical protein
MSIAQLRVAGEGETHPPATTQAESQAATLQWDAPNLPYQTLRAHQRALSLATLPRRARCALAAIAQTVNCRKPHEKIFAHRDYLSDRAGLSERTWYRAEQDLIEAGLISVKEQDRKKRSGHFGSAYIFLAPSAIDMLGFLQPLSSREQPRKKCVEPAAPIVEAPDPASAHSKSNVAFAAKPASAAATRQSDQDQPDTVATADTLSAVEPSAKVADPVYKLYLSPFVFQKRQPGQLPADLERLLELGFRKFFVFKLMKEAAQQGKRLSDVVEVVWEHLRLAQRPIAYLRKLLTIPVDFTHQARTKRDAQRAAHVETQSRVDLQNILAASAGRTFSDRDSTQYVSFDSDASMATVRDRREDIPRIAAGTALLAIAEAIRAGRLVPVNPTNDTASQPPALANPEGSRASRQQLAAGLSAMRASLVKQFAVATRTLAA